jgi:alkaline phosphatase D
MPPSTLAAVTFTHGVTSGEVTPISAVLWTRVDQAADLTVEVARTSAFAPPVLQRTATASSVNDFTVNVLVAPLLPGTTYSYRFRSGQARSDVGTFHTAPDPAQSADVRFTFTGDTDGTLSNGQPAFNSFAALGAARNEAADFFVYLGDTVYPDSPARTTGPATTLDEYRATYQVNRGYPNLRNLLESTSSYTIWDDHEIRDNYTGLTVDPAAYAIGRKTFLEYFPVLNGIAPHDRACAGDPLFRIFKWGKAVDLFILDAHSCQSALAGDFLNPVPPCYNDPLPTLPAGLRPAFGLPASPPPGCLAAINDPSRTVLGAAQKALLKTALRASTARFKFVVTPVNMQQLYFLPYDRWEGYAAERNEILNFIRDNQIKNVLFLTTDTHASIMNEVSVDHFADPTAIAYEFMTGPVAAFTAQDLILGQPTLGAPALAAVNSLLDLIGVDCRNLNAFSYGTVSVNAAAGMATVNLNDANGGVLQNQVVGSTTSCTKTVGP